MVTVVAMMTLVAVDLRLAQIGAPAADLADPVVEFAPVAQRRVTPGLVSVEGCRQCGGSALVVAWVSAACAAGKPSSPAHRQGAAKLNRRVRACGAAPRNKIFNMMNLALNLIHARQNRRARSE
jgi:hypothetical protein